MGLRVKKEWGPRGLHRMGGQGSAYDREATYQQPNPEKGERPSVNGLARMIYKPVSEMLKRSHRRRERWDMIP